VYFDGRTEEEVEDLEDEWRSVSFQSEGVRNLASYLALHRSYVQRLNQSGGNVSKTKAFRRVLKQLPHKYTIIRQSLAAQLESWALKEAANPNDAEVARKVTVAIQELQRRLLKFNREEQLEEEFDVKGMLTMSIAPGESVQYAANTSKSSDNGGKLQRNQCARCFGTGHWAKNCTGVIHKDSRWVDRPGPGGSGIKKNAETGASGSASKKRVCYVCGAKGHIAFRCPDRKGTNVGANQTDGLAEPSDDDAFGLNMLSASFDDEAEELLLPVPKFRPTEAIVEDDFGEPDVFGLLEDDLGLTFASDCKSDDKQVLSAKDSPKQEKAEGSNLSREKLLDDDEGFEDSFSGLMVGDVAEFETEISFLKYVASLSPEVWPLAISTRIRILESSLECSLQEGVLNLSSTFAERGFAIVDSGATSCSEPTITLFDDLHSSVDVNVTTAGGVIKADGVGKLKWSLQDVEKRLLGLHVDNALHLKGAERLLSVYQCVKQGHSVVFSPEKSFLKLKGGRTVPFSVQGKYWVVKIHDDVEHTHEYCLWKRTLAAPVGTTLAHRRLGHASEWSMKMMKQLGLIKGLSWTGPFPHNCRICREYSFECASEQKTREKSDEPGELVAFDFWIPPKGQSALFSVKAILGLRDAATGMCWTYALSTKADLVKQLDVWYNAEVAPNSHITLVSCCCDHENVNLTAEVREWFAEKGVKFVPSPPYMKGRTNIIESFWRPLLVTVRAMLGDQDVQTFYFPAAVVKAAKLKQLLPSKANVGCSSPYALWHRRVPEGGFLRVWGSPAVAKDFKVKSKLEKQAHSGRLLADDESTAWRVMLDETKKLVTSAHVRFDERSGSQRSLDDQVDEMSRVKDDQAGRGYDDKVIADLEAAPRGVPPSSAPLDKPKLPPVLEEHQDSGDTLVVNAPVEVRRSGRVRHAPDQYKAEPGGRNSAQDRTRDEQRALRQEADLVNLQATSMADFYVPCEGAAMVYEDLSDIGVHVCGDVQCDHSAGMFFLGAEFPGERAEDMDDFALFSLDEELQSAKKDKAAFGAGSEVVVDKEAERIVDFVPKNDAEAEKSVAWCASAWRQLAKFEAHKSARVVKDVGQRRGRTIWVRTNKKDAQGNITDNYSRLAIRGDLEVAGLDYDLDDISTYVAEDAHLKILVGAMAVNGWAAFEGDADGAFHQGKPSRPTFVRMPWLPNLRPKKGFLWEILTCVYGKVEAAARFNDKLVEAQAAVGQRVTRSDSAVYVRKSEDGKRLISVCTSHIDDMTQYVTSGDIKEAELVMRGIGKVVTLKEKSMRPLQFMLGRSVHFLQDGAVAIMRRAKIDQMVEDHAIDGSSKQPAKTATDFHTVVAETEQQKRESQQKPLRELVGMLQYIATDRRDIAFVVNNISRYVSPKLRQLKHWYQARQLGGYLKKTRNWAQVFGRNLSVEDRNRLLLYVDSEWCGINGTRFTFGAYVIMWNGGVVASKSFVIKLVCSSTCEAEYVALSEGCKKLRQLSMFCEELCFPQGQNKVFCDNQAAVCIAKGTGPSRGKHIEIRYHFVKDHFKWGFIDLRGVESKENPADMGTKCQPLDLFVAHCEKMGIMDITAELKKLGFKDGK